MRAEGRPDTRRPAEAGVGTDPRSLEAPCGRQKGECPELPAPHTATDRAASGGTTTGWHRHRRAPWRARRRGRRSRASAPAPRGEICPVQRHLDRHADGLVGDGFDEQCRPVLAEPPAQPEPPAEASVLARAHAVDQVTGVEVVVAEWVDTDLDTAPSVGDTIRTSRYPTTASFVEFGTFGVTEHPIVGDVRLEGDGGPGVSPTGRAGDRARQRRQPREPGLRRRRRPHALTRSDRPRTSVADQRHERTRTSSVGSPGSGGAPGRRRPSGGGQSARVPA